MELSKSFRSLITYYKIGFICKRQGLSAREAVLYYYIDRVTERGSKGTEIFELKGKSLEAKLASLSRPEVKMFLLGRAEDIKRLYTNAHYRDGYYQKYLATIKPRL